MIINSLETKIVASCGWVEKSCLLVIDIATRKEDRVKISEAEYIDIKKIPNDHFIAIQHFGGQHIKISIHSFNDPGKKLTEAFITSNSVDFEGEVDLWKTAPKYYTAYLKDKSYGDDYRLIELNPNRKHGIFPNLEWYDNSYDKIYQSVMDVIEIPNTNYLLFSIQRNSMPVLYDILKKKVVSMVRLAGRCGNPIFSFRNEKKELWCVDYDTLVKMRISDWKILKKKCLQLNMQFIGKFSFTKDEEYCAVAIPFNKEIILLRCDSLRVIAKCKSQFQPIDVVVLSNLDFVSRDWQTGKAEFGSFN